MVSQIPPPAELPDVLPERPDGWTRKMQLHMRVQGGGIGIFRVYDERGREMPITWGYNDAHRTRGFALDDTDGSGRLTWQQLRAAWPEFIKGLRADHGG